MNELAHKHMAIFHANAGTVKAGSSFGKRIRVFLLLFLLIQNVMLSEHYLCQNNVFVRLNYS